MFGKVVEILRHAENQMRELMREALADGRYADVAQIAQTADALARLLQTESIETEPNLPVERLFHGAASPHPSKAAATPRHKRAYPRFEREADKLVKIAWSKRDRKEYEHKAPQFVIDSLITSIQNSKGVGAKFVPAEVFPLKHPKSKKEVPSYQSYLAMAWLVHEGVIVKYGRDGYVLKPTAATNDRISSLWSALPARD